MKINTVKKIITFILGFTLGAGCLFIIGYETGYNNGQVNALKGIQKYEWKETVVERHITLKE